MTSSQLLAFVCLGLLVALVHSIPLDELGKHCRKGADQHLDGNKFRASECELSCVQYDHIELNQTTSFQEVKEGVLCTFDLDDNCNDHNEGVCHKNVTFKARSHIIAHTVSKDEMKRGLLSYRGCLVPTGKNIEQAIAAKRPELCDQQCSLGSRGWMGDDANISADTTTCTFRERATNVRVEGHDYLLEKYVEIDGLTHLRSAQLFSGLRGQGRAVDHIELVNEIGTNIDDNNELFHTTRHFLIVVVV